MWTTRSTASEMSALMVSTSKRSGAWSARLRSATSAGGAGDDDVGAGLHAGSQEGRRVGRQGTGRREVLHSVAATGELADRDLGVLASDGWHDRVEPGAVLQGHVHPRRGLVDRPP